MAGWPVLVGQTQTSMLLPTASQLFLIYTKISFSSERNKTCYKEICVVGDTFPLYIYRAGQIKTKKNRLAKNWAACNSVSFYERVILTEKGY